jgi:hypothetical protein
VNGIDTEGAASSAFILVVVVVVTVLAVVVEKAKADAMDDPLCALQCIAKQRAAEEREAGRRRSDGGIAAEDLQLEAKDRRNIHW